MPAIDKTISSGNRYSILLLMLLISAGAIAIPEMSRWMHLSQARTAAADWLVHDFLVEDFEDWWYNQQVNDRRISDQYQAFEKDRLGVDYEHYYSEFGAVRWTRGPSGSFLVSVAQPSRDAKPAFVHDGPQIPDTRADILNLRPWEKRIGPSASFLWVLKALSPEEAAILEGVVGLNTEWKKNNPDKASRLPRPLNENWSADRRWLALGAERDRAALQLKALADGLGVEAKSETTTPALYRLLERRLTSSQFKVPVIDVEMPTQMALWSLAVVVLVVAMLLQVTLEAITAKGLQAREEEWLLLDASGGLSVLLARSWLVFLTLAPVAVPLSIIGILFQRVGASDVGGWRAAAVVLAALGLAVMGGYSRLQRTPASGRR
jgi:hypothetical protein